MLAACSQETNNEVAHDDVTDNVELIRLYQEDQSDRQSGNIDWQLVSTRDSLRRARIYELLDSFKIITSLDYANAAMIFQHGGDTIASGMAVKMMRRAIELDSTANKWLLAAAIDRDFMRKDQPQIYGTQYVKSGANEPWKLYKIDTTRISDAERIEYGVETLAEQKERVILYNKKSLSELYGSGKSVDEIIEFCQAEDLAESAYNLSESGINRFGYGLMAEGKDDEALKIFKLNTELYPDGANTYDSYGECLLKLGYREDAINAYEKSLALDPDNENAEKVLAELKNK